LTHPPRAAPHPCLTHGCTHGMHPRNQVLGRMHRWYRRSSIPSLVDACGIDGSAAHETPSFRPTHVVFVRLLPSPDRATMLHPTHPPVQTSFSFGPDGRVFGPHPTQRRARRGEHHPSGGGKGRFPTQGTGIHGRPRRGKTETIDPTHATPALSDPRQTMEKTDDEKDGNGEGGAVAWNVRVSHATPGKAVRSWERSDVRVEENERTTPVF